MIRLDDLLLGHMKLYQDTEEFCFSLDAILLSHFVKIRPKYVYADLGTGTGVIPHILTYLGAQKVHGFEYNPKTASLAKQSVQYNGLTSCIEIHEMDYRLLSASWNQTVDGIVCNPPYYELGHGKVSQREGRAKALHQGDTHLLEILQLSRRLLRGQGYLWLIYPAKDLWQVTRMLKEERFTLKRMRCVHSYLCSDAKFVLLEAVLGGREGVRIEPPLIIYEKVGTYTKEILSWYEA